MDNKDEILEQLTLAEKHIANAKVLVNEGPTPPDYVPVNPGDNIMQMIADNPENTLFKVHNDFVQNIGDATFPKPCTLQSERARLITCLTVQPNTHIMGMILEGFVPNTILTAADGMTLDVSTLIGNENGQHRGIAVNCKHFKIRKNRVLNIFKDIDTQAIAGWDKTEDGEITENFLEASGENFMLGGSDSSSESAMPRNVLFEANHLTKKLAWRYDPRAKCKNLLELKACENVTIRKNIMEYSFVDGQIGFGVVLTVRNDDGTAVWNTIKDVLLEENIIRHVAGGFNILGRDYIHPSGVMSNVTLRKNKVEDMSWDYGGNGRQIMISGGPDKLTLDGNGFQCTTMPNSALTFDQPQHLLTDFVVKNQELFIEGEYGIFGTDAPGLGKVVLDMYAPGYKWTNNYVQRSGVNWIQWPEGTIFV